MIEMENVVTKVVGDKLTIVIDLGEEGKLSSTGKTLLIATTRGLQPIECKRYGVKLSLNVTTSPYSKVPQS